MDFLHRFACKSTLELLLRADFMASQPHVQEFYFSLLLGPFRPSSIAFEMPDRPCNFSASTLHRRDFWLSAVSLTPFYLLSARLDQDDVAYAEAKLPQTTYDLRLTTYYLLLTTYYLLLNILPAWQGDREFIYFFCCFAEGTMCI